jgi:hypothetical protein
MKTSDSITKIAPALVASQEEIKFAIKDSTNPHFKSRYADLGSVIDSVKKSLNDNGIAFIQTPTESQSGTLALTTRLIHNSGEWIEDTAICPLQKNDPQGYGSALTYMRRYSLASITGLYQDDDDGNAASMPVKPTKSIETYILSLESANSLSELQTRYLSALAELKDYPQAVNQLVKIKDKMKGLLNATK